MNGVKAGSRKVRSSMRVLLFTRGACAWSPVPGLPWQTHTLSWMALRLLLRFQTSPRKRATICMHFEKSKHLLGSEVSGCEHQLAQTRKESSSCPGSEVNAGAAQVGFEVDRPPPADYLPGDLLITMVKKTRQLCQKMESKMKKKVKFVRISHWFDSDESAIDGEIACDCVKLKCANVVLGLLKENFARMHTATHKPTSAQHLKVTMVTHTHTRTHAHTHTHTHTRTHTHARTHTHTHAHTHLIIACGAPRPQAWRGKNIFFVSTLLVQKKKKRSQFFRWCSCVGQNSTIECSSLSHPEGCIYTKTYALWSILIGL